MKAMGNTGSSVGNGRSVFLSIFCWCWIASVLSCCQGPSLWRHCLHKSALGSRIIVRRPSSFASRLTLCCTTPHSPPLPRWPITTTSSPQPHWNDGVPLYSLDILRVSSLCMFSSSSFFPLMQSLPTREEFVPGDI